MSAAEPRAVVLVSGGLDSATTLAIAAAEGYACYALSFAYGQRHELELAAAQRVAADGGAREHKVMPIDLGAFGGSALTDTSLAVPQNDAPQAASGGDTPIPITYVPARNTVFLSLALAWAETLDARHIFIGANAVDYSGYPDCRPEYLAAFERMANLATKVGVEATAAGASEPGIAIRAPLVSLTKGEIIRAGLALGVDYALTLSCYQPNAQAQACGRCDSCHIRRAGFAEAEVADPTVYF